MDFQDGHLNELRRDCAERQKKGLHFILASVFIWAAVLAVSVEELYGAFPRSPHRGAYGRFDV